MTIKPLILVFGAVLLLAKGKGAVALDHGVPEGDTELFSGGLEGFKGFEGRQFSSLVGAAPWLQGAGHLLRLFGDARFEEEKIILCSSLQIHAIIRDHPHYHHDHQTGSTAQCCGDHFDNFHATSWL